MSVGGALVLSRVVPAASKGLTATLRPIALASTIILYVVDRATRRMLPLAALLELTLVFPDEASSRFKVALLSRAPLWRHQRDRTPSR